MPLGSHVTFEFNKKVLCFIDESGVAGTGYFCLGSVFVLARDAGRMDKCFSDLLHANVNEVHARHLADGYLQDLLRRFQTAGLDGKGVLLNREIAASVGSAPAIYAQAVIETVKTGLGCFQQEVVRQGTLGNVDVIIDANHHNGHPVFDSVIQRARYDDDLFRAVNGVFRLDSAASRLLQLADVVAASRRWIVAEELDAEGLRTRFGIQAF